MFFKSKKASLLLLGVTALVGSSVLFRLFNDPEGPNLLVVVGAAGIVYVLSLAAYVLRPSANAHTKLLVAICIQIAAIICLYIGLT